MFKIVRVFNDKVSIASSDRTFFNVPIEEIDFDPKVGDVVQCFRNGEKIIVCKIEPQGVVQNTPVENPLDDDALEKKSRVPWIVGIILLLLGVLLGFIYLNNNNVGTMTDPRDGKTYKIVKIGNQVWMAENLAYEMQYSWDIVSKKTGRHNGRAYPWQVALKACPEGWHLPSGKEFKNLLEFLGGTDNSETGKKLLPRSLFGRLNVTGFDAQMVGNIFFHMTPPSSFDDCYRTKRCKNLEPDAYDYDENAALFWSSDLYNDCPYDVPCGPLPKLGEYLRIESSGEANVWSGFGDGGDRIGLPVRCLQN